MPVLVAAVIAVGLLCVADLLLTFGVIRRLREHTVLLSARLGQTIVMAMSEGETPGSFSAVTTDGNELRGAAGIRTAGFFSSSCSICPRRVPAFVEYLTANHVGREAGLAVVLAEPGELVPYLDQLAAVATVCVQPPDGQLVAAFKVTGYPAFCILDADGAVRMISHDPADLPQLATT